MWISMKKNLLKLLVIAILCAIITLFFCFCSIKYNSSFTSFTTTEQVINEVNEGIDSPGAGWYLLFIGGTAVAIDFAMAISIMVFTLIIPGFLLFMIVVSQSIARLIQIGTEKKWKNTTSKVFTYISIVLQVLVCLSLLFNILSNLIVNKMLLVIALVLNIVCVVLFIKELSKIKKNNTEII